MSSSSKKRSAEPSPTEASKSQRTPRKETAGPVDDTTGVEGESDQNPVTIPDGGEEADKDPDDKFDPKAWYAEAPYAYTTRCQPYEFWEKDNEKKPENEQLDEDELMNQYPCGKKETCMCCYKDAKDFPDWKWVMMRATKEMLSETRSEADYRDQDLFGNGHQILGDHGSEKPGMHVYNDFTGYGILEVLENLLLKFDKAKGSKERWVIVSTIAHWLTAGNTPMFFGNIDDGERVGKVLNVVGYTLLAALDDLDREGLLGPDTEVRDLALVMVAFLDIYASFHDSTEKQEWAIFVIFFAEEKKIDIDASPATNAQWLINSTKDEFKDQFADSEEETELELPEARAADRFRFRTKLQNYRGSYKTGRDIGGKQYDITKMSSGERKKYAFGNEDPIPADIRKALAKGEKMFLCRA